MEQIDSKLASIIVSPQAGFANRLRVVNSAILAAQICSRRLYHYWIPTEPNHTQSHVNWIKQSSINDFFYCNQSIQLAQATLAPDLILSEWKTGDYWFTMQSHAQEDFGVLAGTRAHNYLNKLINSDAKTILIETSRRFWPRDNPGLSFSIPKHDEAMRIHNAYTQLQPRAFYLDLVEKYDQIEVGIAVRRGDLLKYSAKARQSIEDIYKFVKELTSMQKRIMIFSDDEKLVDYLTSMPGIKQEYPNLRNIIKRLLPPQKAMVTFLFLALKCQTIYGTPTSSFAQEAALYGNQKYLTIPETLQNSQAIGDYQ